MNSLFSLTKIKQEAKDKELFLGKRKVQGVNESSKIDTDLQSKIKCLSLTA